MATDKEQRPISAQQQLRSQADIARDTSTKLADARPKKAKVIAINDGYDNLRLYKAGSKFTVSLKENEAIPLWAVTEEEWNKRRAAMIDAQEDFDENDEGQIAVLEEELARAMWREKDEAAVERAQVAAKERKRKEAAEAFALAGVK